jgi:hypothetical protein
MRKLIFVIFIPLSLSLQKDDKLKTTMFYNDHLEVLNGKVKQLIVMGMDLRGTPFMMNYADTTYFNKKGDEVETYSGWSDGLHVSKKFDFKYSKDGKELEFLARLGNGKTIYKYDKYDRIIGAYYYNVDGIYEKILYRYDMLGNINQTEAYDKSNALRHKIAYTYNDKRLLLKENYFALNSNTYTSDVLYEYKSFDNRNNWTKQIRKMKNSSDTGFFNIDTVTRKITYY